MQNFATINVPNIILKKPRVNFTSTIKYVYLNNTSTTSKANNSSGCAYPDNEAVKDTIESYFKQEKSMREKSLFYTNSSGTKMYVLEITVNDGIELIEEARKI